jgi:hypothetical protein
MTSETNKARSDKMKGNNNAAKAKLFTDRIKMNLTQDPVRLNTIVMKLIELAEEGEAWAVKEIMDRTEGKAHQSTSLEDGEGNNLLQAIEVRFVTPLALPSPVDE